jgi:hypothetical protein
MAQPPKKPPNPKFGGAPVRNKPKAPSMPQASNLTPPNATGIKATKPKAKKKASGKVSVGTGKNGLYW